MKEPLRITNYLIYPNGDGLGYTAYLCFQSGELTYVGDCGNYWKVWYGKAEDGSWYCTAN